MVLPHTEVGEAELITQHGLVDDVANRLRVAGAGAVVIQSDVTERVQTQFHFMHVNGNDERGCRIPGVLASLGQRHPQRVEAHATEAQRAHVEALDVEVVALAGRGIVADLLPDALADLV